MYSCFCRSRFGLNRVCQRSHLQPPVVVYAPRWSGRILACHRAQALQLCRGVSRAPNSFHASLLLNMAGSKASHTCMLGYMCLFVVVQVSIQKHVAYTYIPTRQIHAPGELFSFSLGLSVSYFARLVHIFPLTPIQIHVPRPH